MALSIWGRLEVLRAEDFALEETYLLLSKSEHRIGKEALHTDRKRVSTSHIALRRDAASGAVTITDTSQWGTFVGGVKLDFKKPTPLAHGALITLAIAEYSECMFALRFHSSDGKQLESMMSPPKRSLLVSSDRSPFPDHPLHPSRDTHALALAQAQQSTAALLGKPQRSVSSSSFSSTLAPSEGAPSEAGTLSRRSSFGKSMQGLIPLSRGNSFAKVPEGMPPGMPEMPSRGASFAKTETVGKKGPSLPPRAQSFAKTAPPPPPPRRQKTAKTAQQRREEEEKEAERSRRSSALDELKVVAQQREEEAAAKEASKREQEVEAARLAALERATSTSEQRAASVEQERRAVAESEEKERLAAGERARRSSEERAKLEEASVAADEADREAKAVAAAAAAAAAAEAKAKSRAEEEAAQMAAGETLRRELEDAALRDALSKAAAREERSRREEEEEDRCASVAAAAASAASAASAEKAKAEAEAEDAAAKAAAAAAGAADGLPPQGPGMREAPSRDSLREPPELPPAADAPAAASPAAALHVSSNLRAKQAKPKAVEPKVETSPEANAARRRRRSGWQHDRSRLRAPPGPPLSLDPHASPHALTRPLRWMSPFRRAVAGSVRSYRTLASALDSTRAHAATTTPTTTTATTTRRRQRRRSSRRRSCRPERRPSSRRRRAWRRVRR